MSLHPFTDLSELTAYRALAVRRRLAEFQRDLSGAGRNGAATALAPTPTAPPVPALVDPPASDPRASAFAKDYRSVAIRDFEITDLLRLGLVKAGVGVLTCSWWGLELPHAATLTGHGKIREQW